MEKKERKLDKGGDKETGNGKEQKKEKEKKR